jgi:FixJ family two-component response regulator
MEMALPPINDDLKPTVVIIDDDRDVREALGSLFRSVGLRVEAFASAQEFLNGSHRDTPGCMILDVRLPGQSGLEFFDAMIKADQWRPVIFISGHADIPMSVRAMKAGAVEFLTKPVRDQDLLDAVQVAIAQDFIRRSGAQDIAAIQDKFKSLTHREREIMTLVVIGRRNKEIAAHIGISEATVKLHRGHLMRKMNAQSVADLVRMADTVEKFVQKL